MSGKMFQPTSAQPTPKTELISAARRAVWISLIYALGSIIVVLIYIFLMVSQGPAWQLLVLTALGVVMIGVALLNVRWSQHGRYEPGIRLLIGLSLVAVLTLSSLVAGLGLIVGLTGVLVILLLSVQTLSQKEINLILAISMVVAILAGLIDTTINILAWNTQLEAPIIRIALPIIAAGIILAAGILIGRQFRSYPLSTKLLITFLIVNVIAVTGLAYVSSFTSRNALTNEVGGGLKRLAESQALVVGNLLDRQVNTLQALALNGNLRNSVNALNSVYLNNDPAAIQAKLKDLDRDWKAADNDDPLIRSRIENLLSKVELAQFYTNFPDHVEVLITDRHGALIAATRRTANYDQSNQDWWKAAYHNGEGAVYIGPPQLNEGFQNPGSVIAVPLFAPDSDEVVGILRSIYDIKGIKQALSKARPNQTHQFHLYLPGALELGADDPLPTFMSKFSPAGLARALESEVGYIEFTYENEPTLLVSVAPVVDITDDPLITQLGWSLGVSQEQEEALTPVRDQEQTVQLVGLIIVAISGAVAFGLAYLLSKPILRLTDTAQQIAGGDLSARATVEASDEIGTLATVFNAMTGRLRQTIDTLEERVAERTRQLETVVETSQKLTGILELGDLLRQVVNITKETFKYYHVHIYLLDDQKETLYLAEGYGQAGAEMKRQGHSIPLASPQSLVARAARESRTITVENVRRDPTWLPNPLLPDTHSEMATPVMLGGEIVGVLDVQSEKIGGLTAQDEATLQALANQVAIAVRNARLFAQTEAALDEAQRLQRLYTGQAWEGLRITRSTTDYEYRHGSLPPLAEIATPEAGAALQQAQTVKAEAAPNGQKMEEHETELHAKRSSLILHPSSAALATPLKLRDTIIGVLGVHPEDPHHAWTEDEVALIEAVSEQMSLAIENARLFETTGRQATREKIIADMTRRIWASGEMERVMQTAAEQLGLTLAASKVVIRLGTEEQLVQESSHPKGRPQIGEDNYD